MGRNFQLPKEKRVKILTMEMDWMSPVVDALLEGKTCILPVGCGAYILVGAISIKKGKKVAQLINTQKGRSKDRPVAYYMPPEEIPFWVEHAYQTQVKDVVNKLNSRPFGIIAPINKKVPHWHRVEDKVHDVYEKLFVWGDIGSSTGPSADLYHYIRHVRGLTQEKFTLIGTSGNATGLPNNNHFAKVYEQLGDKRGIAYGVFDSNEGGPYSLDPVTIISVMPMLRGQQKMHIYRLGSMSVSELSGIIPNAEKKSKIGLVLYRLRARLEKFNRKITRQLV